MDETNEPDDDQPQLSSDFSVWLVVKTRELTRRVLSGQTAPAPLDLFNTLAKIPMIPTDEHANEPDPMSPDDMISVTLSHLFFQALIETHPERADEFANLSYTEALHRLYQHEHA